MLHKLFSIALLLFPIHQIDAQSGTISVGPLLTCGLTTFSCPNGGCCTIGGCCGSGCCANGYACINEGTSDEACCWSFDPTKCGTAPLPSSSSDPDTGSGEHTCVGVEACPALNGNPGYTCFFGETCGYGYRVCDPCPYLGVSGASSSFSEDTPSPTTSFDSDPASTSFSDSTPSTSSSSNRGAFSASSSATGPKPTSSSASAPNAGSSTSTLLWSVIASFGGVLGIFV